MAYRTWFLPFVVCGLVLTGLASKADAGIHYSFVRITNNNGGINLGSQLDVEVKDLGTDGGGYAHVGFKFTNLVGIASSITDVYFDDGTLLGISSISDSGSGVAFSPGGSPSNLPGGNAIDFNTTAGFLADSDSPVSGNGVNIAGEWVMIDFKLFLGKTYDGLLAAIDSGVGKTQDVTGDLRIGLHVQAIGAPGGSDSYVNGGRNGNQDNPPIVPEPASLAIWGMGLGLVALVGRRFRRKAV